MGPLVLEESEPTLEMGRFLCRRNNGKTPQGEPAQRPDLLQCLPAPDSSQPPKQNQHSISRSCRNLSCPTQFPLPACHDTLRWGRAQTQRWWHRQEPQRTAGTMQPGTDCRWLLLHLLHLAPLLIHSHPSATKQSGLTVKQVVT